MCAMKATRDRRARTSDGRLGKPAQENLYPFFHKEGSVLINRHISQSCAGDKVHILPYCVIRGGLFLLQEFSVILEGLTV